MSCHVCSRAHSPRLSFYCTTCARNQLYQLRLENARLGLEKEALGRQIESAVAGERTERKGSEVEVAQDSEQKQSPWAVQVAQTEGALSLARSKATVAHMDMLKSEIKEKRSDISRRRMMLAQRRSDAESANYQLTERQTATLTNVQNGIKRTEHLWHALHNKTAESRVFLCREAASVYGLRQKLRKKNGEVRASYVIGGVTIVDLREMNGSTPSQISTVFSNIAHLLVLVSHYLSLRLPAEITLPHRNYPVPTIFTLAASYSRDAPSSRTSPPQSLSNSPSTSRTADGRHIPHPRPLFIEKTLPKLAKEDPAVYALFLEGASLLAWNVAWLCRTQGLNIGSDSWEDICNIGKNMWQLLVAPPAKNSSVTRVISGRDLQSKLKAGKDSPKTTIQRTKSFPMLGHYSHGTSHSFLGAAEGTEFMRTWKLPMPMKIVDRLKSALLGEMASAEWELLEKEWDDEIQEQPRLDLKDTPVQDKLEPGARDRSAEENNTTSIETAETTRPDMADTDAPGNPKTDSNEPNPLRPKDTSSWTKLKSR